MRLVGWPTKYEREEGLTPVDLQDIDLHATAEEILMLANFLNVAAGKLAQAERENESLSIGIDFGDDKPDPETGIWVNIVRHSK